MEHSRDSGANISSGLGQKSSTDQQQQHRSSLTENGTNSSAKQQQRIFSINNIDVRMKRHPELQPYMPCDRFVSITTPARPPTAKNAFGGSSKLGPARYGPTSGTSGTSTVASSNNKPKKYVSMTRLNQLAQPKRRPQTQQKPAKSTVPPSSLTSSEQLSETSITDRHFQSAVSEILVPEHIQISEITQSNDAPKSPIAQQISSNQINQTSTPINNLTVNLSDRNRESLIRDLKDFALSEGIVLDDSINEKPAKVDEAESRVSSTANHHNSFSNDLLTEQHESTATTWVPEKAGTPVDNHCAKLDTPSAENGLCQDDDELRRQHEEEEDERNRKIEEELKEMARREEEEREKRGKLVDSILSRFSQGSP